MAESLKEIRCRVKQDLQQFNALKKQAYDHFHSVLKLDSKEDIVFISMEELSTLKVGEVVKDLAEGVEFVKLFENENEMLFHTMLIEGVSFNLHYHDCVEICKVLEGCMIETQRANTKAIRYYGKNERAIYDKGEKHALHAQEYTLIEVRFLKDV